MVIPATVVMHAKNAEQVVRSLSDKGPKNNENTGNTDRSNWSNQQLRLGVKDAFLRSIWAYSGG